MKVDWIWSLWQQRKCTTQQALEALLVSRARGSLRAIEDIKSMDLQMERRLEQVEIDRVQGMLAESLQGFRPDPRVDKFMLQFSSSAYGIAHRFRTLGLFGGSQIGKSQKGLSLFGISRTLKVSCQGLGKGIIPSIVDLDRQQHGCILWDEIRSDQVLGNKEVFQSGAFLIRLSQSQCNRHMYSKWLYSIAHVLCSNCFPMSVEEGLSEEDAEWLSKNVWSAVLPAGEKWYFDVDGEA